MIRRYRDYDYVMLLDWYTSRGIQPMKDFIPKIGFVVPGVAAGFLLSTDTKCCVFEPFITNPKANKQDRKHALDLIMEHLINEAKNLGFTRIFGFTNNPRMAELTLDWGFNIIEKNVVTVLKEIQ